MQSQAQPSQPQPSEPPMMGSYRILRRIAEGAMGELFEACHLRLAGRYALKVLVPELAAEPVEAYARFRREAEALSRLQHPNVVRVLDFDISADGRPYLAMEFLDGTLLRDEMDRQGPMPVARVLSIVGQVASALAAVHAQGIVHRDLKPENLFLLPPSAGGGELVKLTDFGISKLEEPTDGLRLTRANTVLGSPSYMSPEQALSRLDEVDHRTDQFALAAIAYELLTGRMAFPGDSLGEILCQVIDGQPAPLGELRPDLSSAFCQVIERGLAKNREDRFADVLELWQAMVRAAGEPGPEPFAWACEEVPLEGPTRLEEWTESLRRLPPSTITLAVAVPVAMMLGVAALALVMPPRQAAAVVARADAAPAVVDQRQPAPSVAAAVACPALLGERFVLRPTGALAPSCAEAPRRPAPRRRSLPWSDVTSGREPGKPLGEAPSPTIAAGRPLFNVDWLALNVAARFF